MTKTVFCAVIMLGVMVWFPTVCAAGEQPAKPIGRPDNQLRLVRNATMKISYAGQSFLTDPMFSPRGAMRAFAGIASNPTVELPFPISEILSGVETVIVSHIHPDHFDPAAIEAIPDGMPVLCQPGDEGKIAAAGFRQVTPVADSYLVNGVTITRTGGKHGSDKILEYTGKVSGFVLQAAGEPTVYWVGDSVFCAEVQEAIRTFKPDIIITHSGGATLPGHAPIVMNAEQTLEVAAFAPDATIIAVHMESLDHCNVSRENLRRKATDAGVSVSRLRIPADGETVSF